MSFDNFKPEAKARDRQAEIEAQYLPPGAGNPFNGFRKVVAPFRKGPLKYLFWGIVLAVTLYGIFRPSDTAHFPNY